MLPAPPPTSPGQDTEVPTQQRGNRGEVTRPRPTGAGAELLIPRNPRVESKALLLGSNASIPLEITLWELQGRHCPDRAFWSPIKVILDWHRAAGTAGMQRRGKQDTPVMEREHWGLGGAWDNKE